MEEEKQQAKNSFHNPDPVIGRRRFMNSLLGLWGVATLAGVLTPIIAYLVPPATGSGGGGGRVQVGTTQDIPIGQGKVVSLGNQPVIVTNTSNGVKAFSAICTHLGCISIWDPTRQTIVCPCHDGIFSPVTGEVIAGPPPAPLPAIPASVEGEDIYIGEA
jgi:cytochrome b6-f complex iron-sulfur subunit